ncbi:hypothetical protein Tco_0541617, partial [Tanacetum coccineum]
NLKRYFTKRVGNAIRGNLYLIYQLRENGGTISRRVGRSRRARRDSSSHQGAD